MNETTMHCITLCLANAFDFKALSESLLANRRASLLKDVLLIEHDNAYSMVFPYGVVVH